MRLAPGASQPRLASLSGCSTHCQAEEVRTLLRDHHLPERFRAVFPRASILRTRVGRIEIVGAGEDERAMRRWLVNALKATGLALEPIFVSGGCCRTGCVGCLGYRRSQTTEEQKVFLAPGLIRELDRRGRPRC